MWVDAVRLRNLGEKIDRAIVRSTAPIRGHLELRTYVSEAPEWDPTRGPRVVCEASLSDGETLLARMVLPYLSQARVTQIKHGFLLVAGVELIGERHHEKPYRQVWCCTPTSPPGAA